MLRAMSRGILRGMLSGVLRGMLRGLHSFSLQDLALSVSRISHGPEHRKSCYMMLQAYTFCEECCEALTLSVSRNSLFESPGFQART